jgi:glycosyltransferase involved in cell wall biosynthesis
MKIAYFVPLYPAVSLTFIAREIRSLGKLGHTITVFAGGKADQDLDHPEFVQREVEVIYPSRFKSGQFWSIVWANFVVFLVNPGGYLKSIFWMKRSAHRAILGWKTLLQIGYYSFLIRKKKIQRIHAHFALDWALLGLLASWMVKVPFSVTTHAGDLFVKSHPEILPQIFDEADWVVTISDYNRNFLLQTYESLTPDRVVVVHCGIDMADFPFAKRSYLPKEPLSIITVARLVEKKGHRVLLNALQLLKKQGHPFTWQIVGRGPLSAALQVSVHQAQLNEVVQFVGATTYQHIKSLLMTADVMVLPCVQSEDGDQDGIPVALMEAMAVGLPVISTTVSGIPELITHKKTGLLVRPNDSAALAKALCAFLENQYDLSQLIAQAHRKVCNDFNIEIESARLAALFGWSSSKSHRVDQK